MASDSLRTGVIGFGLAGRYFHTPLLLAAGFDVRCVASSRRDEVLSVLPHAEVVATADELIARADIDVVVIASPNNVHAAQARASLDAGKHVVVDKPLCTSAQEARELASHAAQRGRVLAVFQNRRWDSDMLTICKLLADDRLGEINAWHARWDRYRPEVTDRWRERDEPGAGMLFDLGSHLIDQVLFLFGRPDWIQADVFAQRAGAIADDGFELLLGKDALRITLAVSSLASDGGPRYRIHGAKASFVKSGFDPQEPQLRAGMVPTDPQFGREAREHWGSLTSGVSGASELVPTETGRWVKFYEALRTSIESGAAPPVSALEAARTLEVIEAAQRSAAEGRRVALAG